MQRPRKLTESVLSYGNSGGTVLIGEADTQGLTFSLPQSHPPHNNTSGSAGIKKFRSTQPTRSACVLGSNEVAFVCSLSPNTSGCRRIAGGSTRQDPQRYVSAGPHCRHFVCEEI